MWYNMHMAGTCFVIQPFDGGGDFDTRYEDVFVPAINDAGLKDYRVDRDTNSVFPNEDIKNGIRDAAACLADISLDNFNVALEIGIAITLGINPVLVCAEARKGNLPFDIQERNTIFYKTASRSDFDKLQRQISEQLKARLRDATTPGRVMASASVIATGDSLNQYELSTLVEIGAGQYDHDDAVPVRDIRQNLSQRYHKLAVIISLGSLCDKGFITKQDIVEGFEEIPAYGLTPKGLKWLRENEALLPPLDKPQPESANQPSQEQGFGDMEDIPF